MIQDLGRLSLAGLNRLTVHTHSPAILQNLEIGDSIAIDGVCLTVEQIQSQGFMVAVSPETLKRTTLEQQATTGAPVNLEASLQVGSKLGGHFVTGHVDALGYLQVSEQTADSWEMSFTAPGAIARYIVPKGSIAVNGVSLTVSDCNPEGTWFKTAVIPHSFATTNLQHLQPGERVNLEADLLGKYTEKFLRLPQSSLRGSGALEPITAEFLAEHGFS
ncbi:MAG TPA: riboflavin synthase [Candidatus Caenarcaniphilales bacterium]